MNDIGNKSSDDKHIGAPAIPVAVTTANEDDDIADIQMLAEQLAQERTDSETQIQIIEATTLADWVNNGVTNHE